MSMAPGAAGRVEADAFISQGADYVLPKPLNVHAFHATLRNFFGTAKSNKKKGEKKEKEEKNYDDEWKGQRKQITKMEQVGGCPRQRQQNAPRRLRVLVVDDSKPTR